jgi:hypothetical protein
LSRGGRFAKFDPATSTEWWSREGTALSRGPYAAID